MSDTDYAEFFQPGAPGPMAGEAGALTRKQRLVAMLTQKALTPLTPFRGGFGAESPMSPFQGLAQLAQAYFARTGSEDLTKEQAALGDKYNAGAAQAIGNYIDTLNGKPGQEAVAPAEARGPIEGMASPSSASPGQPAVAPVAPNPKAAMIEAFASPYAPVKQVAQMMLANQLKNQLTAKDLLSLPADISAQSKIAAATGGGAAALQPAPKIEKYGKDDTVVDVNPTAQGKSPTVLAKGEGTKFETNPDGSPRITWLKGADGQLEPYQREDIPGGKLLKLDTAPKISITNTLKNQGEIAGAKQIFEKAADTVNDLGKQARGAIQMKNSITQMEALEQKGVFSNATSGMKTLATNVAQALGANLTVKQLNDLGNSETFNSIGINAWQNLVSQFGGNRGITAQEAETIHKIIPQLSSSPQARQQLYRILSDSADRQVGQFHMANAALTEALQKKDSSIWQQKFADIFAPNPTEPPVKPSPTQGEPKFIFTPKGR